MPQILKETMNFFNFNFFTCSFRHFEFCIFLCLFFLIFPLQILGDESFLFREFAGRFPLLVFWVVNSQKDWSLHNEVDLIRGISLLKNALSFFKFRKFEHSAEQRNLNAADLHVHLFEKSNLINHCSEWFNIFLSLILLGQVYHCYKLFKKLICDL